MNKEDVYVGIKNPSVITRVINNYHTSVDEFADSINELLETRQNFEITKVEFLDELMDFVQEYAQLKQEVPVVKFKTLDHKKIKKRLKKKVKLKKQELEENKAKKVAKQLKEKLEAPPIKPSDDLIRIKNFRKDLEKLNKQISDLDF